MRRTRTRDLHERREGGTRDRQVVPGHGEAAVQTRGIQKEHHHGHGEAEAPRRHAEHAMRTAVASAVGYHGNHSTAHSQLTESGSTQGWAEGFPVEVRTTRRIHDRVGAGEFYSEILKRWLLSECPVVAQQRMMWSSESNQFKVSGFRQNPLIFSGVLMTSVKLKQLNHINESQTLKNW